MNQWEFLDKVISQHSLIEIMFILGAISVGGGAGVYLSRIGITYLIKFFPPSPSSSSSKPKPDTLEQVIELHFKNLELMLETLDKSLANSSTEHKTTYDKLENLRELLKEFKEQVKTDHSNIVETLKNLEGKVDELLWRNK